MEEPLLKRIISRPPVLFPLAALFHILISASAVITLYPIPLSQRDWLRPVSMILFTLISLSLCLMKKWAAFLYIVFSITCLSLVYFTPADSPMHIFGEGFFPFNLILSFFILLFFKRFK